MLIHRYLLADLSGDGDLVVGFKTQRTLAFVGVVKGNGHGGLGDATLSILVHQVLEVGGSHLSGEINKIKSVKMLLANS